jgi:hypothetical protein
MLVGTPQRAITVPAHEVGLAKRRGLTTARKVVCQDCGDSGGTLRRRNSQDRHLVCERCHGASALRRRE